MCSKENKQQGEENPPLQHQGSYVFLQQRPT